MAPAILGRYFNESVDGVLFVVDAGAGLERLVEGLEALAGFLREAAVLSRRTIPVIILANKIEIEGALALDRIRQEASAKLVAIDSLGRAPPPLHCLACSLRGNRRDSFDPVLRQLAQTLQVPGVGD